MAFDEMLNDLRDRKALVDFRRDRLNVGDLRGYLLDYSEELMLIGVVSDFVRHDGYRIIAREDLTYLRWDTDILRGWRRAAISLAGEVAEGPKVDLEGWSGAIRSLDGVAELLTFHRHRLDSSTCYIALRFELREPWLIGDQLTSEATHDGRFAMLLEDLTQIDFGGSYEKGLSLAAEIIGF